MYWPNPPFLFGDKTSCLSEPDSLLVMLSEHIDDKKELLNQLGVGLGLPAFDAWNWDAMDECLCDLSWVEQRQICIVHDTLPLESVDRDLQVYLQMLLDAIAANEGIKEVKVVFPDESAGHVEHVVSQIRCKEIRENELIYDESVFDCFNDESEVVQVELVAYIDAGVSDPQRLFYSLASQLSLPKPVSNMYELWSSLAYINWRGENRVMIIHRDLPFDRDAGMRNTYIDILVRVLGSKGVGKDVVRAAFPNAVMPNIAAAISSMKADALRRCEES